MTRIISSSSRLLETVRRLIQHARVGTGHVISSLAAEGGEKGEKSGAT